MDGMRLPRRRPPRAVMLGVIVAVGFAGSVAMLGERGAFSPIGAVHAIAVIPGVTVADDAGNAAMPVVTSLRSDGEAERLGVRVGDRIAAIDGLPVRDVDSLYRAIRRRTTAGPVSLHLRRGDTVWTVSIDRTESDHRNPDSQSNEPHDPQDPAG